MGKTPDLIGKKFNFLTVLEKTEERKRGAVVWKCLCDCGNMKKVTTTNLIKNRVMSCGCYNKRLVSNNYKDIINQRFGRLVVIKKTNKRTNRREIIWKCKCDCGQECETTSDRLTRGITKSCGCLQKEVARSTGLECGKNLINKKFGKLTPFKLTYLNGERAYLCQCDCGGAITVKSKYLLRGSIKSCGCLKTSAGEYVIEQILLENKIPFIKQYHTKDCKFPDTNYYAYFDFYVNNSYIIEYDGQQHFSPQCFNGMNELTSNEQFIKTQEHDSYKNEWCKNNNIPLIRIPYIVKVQNINLEMLIPKTSKFLLKE